MSIFGKIAKAVVGTVAKTVVGSVPILGGLVSAVGAVKSSIHPPTLANTAGVSARTGVPAFGQPGMMTTAVPRALRRARAKPKTHARRRSKAHSPRKRSTPHGRSSAKRGVSAKQLAARKRFARAAKRGPIRKGSHL